MKRFIILGALLAAVASPLAAQQDSTRAQQPTPTPASVPAPASAPASNEAPAATSSGPRVRAEFRPAVSHTSSMYQGDNHTISVSTLVLVLLVVVLVLLVVR